MNTSSGTLPRRRCGTHCRPRHGFTLVELLVVIGIIATLVAMLMPALAGARRQAQLLQCSSNLRTIGQALQMHALDHQQYVPIQGYIAVGDPSRQYCNPSELLDPAMKKYDYYFDGAWGLSPLPLPGALAPYLGGTILTDSFNDMEAAVHSTGNTVLRTTFQCPADLLNGTDPTGEVLPEGISGYGYNQLNLGETSSYLTNAGVFGWQPEYGFARARGCLLLLSDASEQIMMIDGLPAPPTYLPWGDMEFFDHYPMSTLWDAYLQIPPTFDFVRHHGYLNALFLDGHVETISMTQGAMSNIYINKNISTPPGTLMYPYP